MLEKIISLTVAGSLLAAAFRVVLAKSTIHRALWLVFCFITTAALWISLHAEFLGLVLILVYVGAVLTLFLFVIMTLPGQTEVLLDTPPFSYMLLTSILVLTGLGSMLYALQEQLMHTFQPSMHLSNAIFQENTQKLGLVLYTQYSYPFELAGVLLLVAIIVSISLHSSPSKGDHPQCSKKLSKQEQISTKREDRIKLVSGE